MTFRAGKKPSTAAFSSLKIWPKRKGRRWEMFGTDTQRGQCPTLAHQRGQARCAATAVSRLECTQQHFRNAVSHTITRQPPRSLPRNYTTAQHVQDILRDVHKSCANGRRGKLVFTATVIGAEGILKVEEASVLDVRKNVSTHEKVLKGGTHVVWLHRHWRVRLPKSRNTWKAIRTWTSSLCLHGDLHA